MQGFSGPLPFPVLKQVRSSGLKVRSDWPKTKVEQKSSSVFAGFLKTSPTPGFKAGSKFRVLGSGIRILAEIASVRIMQNCFGVPTGSLEAPWGSLGLSIKFEFCRRLLQTLNPRP